MTTSDNATSGKGGFEALPNPGSDEALDRGCSCPVIDNGHGRGVVRYGGKPIFTINLACQVHGEPAHRRDPRPCPSCGNRIGDPAWRHVGALVMTIDGDFAVTECHRALVADEKTGKPVPKFPDERELREAFGG